VAVGGLSYLSIQVSTQQFLWVLCSIWGQALFLLFLLNQVSRQSFLKQKRKNQCSGSVTFWYGSANLTTDLDLDLAPDPALFITTVPVTFKAQKKNFFSPYSLKVYLHYFSKIKSHKLFGTDWDQDRIT
jgi:hypothetical protein